MAFNSPLPRQNQPFYERPLVIVLAVVFLWPLGLFLALRHPSIWPRVRPYFLKAYQAVQHIPRRKVFLLLGGIVGAFVLLMTAIIIYDLTPAGKASLARDQKLAAEKAVQDQRKANADAEAQRETALRQARTAKLQQAQAQKVAEAQQAADSAKAAQASRAYDEASARAFTRYKSDLKRYGTPGFILGVDAEDPRSAVVTVSNQWFEQYPGVKLQSAQSLYALWQRDCQVRGSFPPGFKVADQNGNTLAETDIDGNLRVNKE